MQEESSKVHVATVENKVTNRQTVDRRQTQLATKTEAVVVSNALIATNTQVMWQKIVQKKGKSRSPGETKEKETGMFVGMVDGVCSNDAWLGHN